MPSETNPLKNKESEDLEKQLEGDYETSDIETQITLVKDELEFLEITLETINDFGAEDPTGIEKLKNKALFDKKNLQKKLKNLNLKKAREGLKKQRNVERKMRELDKKQGDILERISVLEEGAEKQDNVIEKIKDLEKEARKIEEEKTKIMFDFENK